MQLAVEVGYRFEFGEEQSPQRFYVGTRAVGVVDILDRWLSAELRYFKLAGDDGGTYILRHDVVAAKWELTLFDSGRVHRPLLSSQMPLNGAG